MGTYVSYVSNVGFYAIVSDNVDDIVHHVCTIFPHASFYVIGVTHKLKSRHHYTSLYADIMHSLVKESILNIASRLKAYGCSDVREVVLEGKLTKVIPAYIKKKRINALVVVTSLKPQVVEVVSPVIEKLILSVRTPLLIYTPFFKFQGKESIVTLALQSLSYINGSVSAALSLAKNLNAQLEVVTMKRSGRIQMEKFKRYLLRSNIVFGLNTIVSSSMDEFMSKVLKLYSNSLILVTRRYEGRLSSVLSILGLRKLESYERILMSISPIPVLLI